MRNFISNPITYLMRGSHHIVIPNMYRVRYILDYIKVGLNYHYCSIVICTIVPLYHCLLYCSLSYHYTIIPLYCCLSYHYTIIYFTVLYHTIIPLYHYTVVYHTIIPLFTLLLFIIPLFILPLFHFSILSYESLFHCVIVSLVYYRSWYSNTRFGWLCSCCLLPRQQDWVYLGYYICCCVSYTYIEDRTFWQIQEEHVLNGEYQTWLNW